MFHHSNARNFSQFYCFSEPDFAGFALRQIVHFARHPEDTNAFKAIVRGFEGTFRSPKDPGKRSLSTRSRVCPF
jgi:hypothetical protein